MVVKVLQISSQNNGKEIVNAVFTNLQFCIILVTKMNTQSENVELKTSENVAQSRIIKNRKTRLRGYKTFFHFSCSVL